ncbi:MAG: sulfur carrier protein ThiS [Pseudomonadota bacterium]
MIIILNGEEITSFQSTLAGLCAEKGFEEESITTAMNGIFVPREMRQNTVLEDGDKIEVLVPLQGG